MKYLLAFFTMTLPVMALTTNNNTAIYQQNYAVSVVKTNPTSPSELASKAYVDAQSGGGSSYTFTNDASQSAGTIVSTNGNVIVIGNAPSSGGGSDIFAASNNVFTGNNTFSNGVINLYGNAKITSVTAGNSYIDLTLGDNSAWRLDSNGSITHGGAAVDNAQFSNGAGYITGTGASNNFFTITAAGDLSNNLQTAINGKVNINNGTATNLTVITSLVVTGNETVTGSLTVGGTNIGDAVAGKLNSGTGGFTLNGQLLSNGGSATISGGSSVTKTNYDVIRFTGFRNTTTNDFLGGIILGNGNLDSSTASSNFLYSSVICATTNASTGSAFAKTVVPLGYSNVTAIGVGFRYDQVNAAQNGTNFFLTIASALRAASVTFTGLCTSINADILTNFPTTGTYLTNNLAGERLDWTWAVSGSSTSLTTYGSRGISQDLRWIQP